MIQLFSRTISNRIFDPRCMQQRVYINAVSTDIFEFNRFIFAQLFPFSRETFQI